MPATRLTSGNQPTVTLLLPKCSCAGLQQATSLLIFLISTVLHSKEGMFVIFSIMMNSSCIQTQAIEDVLLMIYTWRLFNLDHAQRM